MKNQKITEVDYQKVIVWCAIILFCLAFWFIVISCARADEIDMSKIAQIESSNNPLAWDKKDDSRGLYQITPICLKEYNAFHKRKYFMDDLWTPEINFKIADWYLNTRIPQMLSHFKISDTVENRIIAYNAGISCLVNGRHLPKITQEYIKKYKR